MDIGQEVLRKRPVISTELYWESQEGKKEEQGENVWGEEEHVEQGSQSTKEAERQGEERGRERRRGRRTGRREEDDGSEWVISD